MPLYEYQCQSCHETVELLVRGSTEQPVCPKCGSSKLDKQLSVAASPAIVGHSLPTTSAPGPTCGRPQCGSGCMFD
ncbi:MAG: zinc ribbon domain-containing protein [Planctomycetales bacterium]|nr:zinc ribbon domain-containing protein [Planctomycetales bacterium]